MVDSPDHKPLSRVVKSISVCFFSKVKPFIHIMNGIEELFKNPAVCFGRKSKKVTTQSNQHLAFFKFIQSQGQTRHDLNFEHERNGLKSDSTGTSPVDHWPRLCTPNAGSLGYILGQRTRSHMP